MQTKNILILGAIGVAIYFIFFNKKELNEVVKVADTIPEPIGKGGCGCNKNKNPKVAPKL